MSMTGAPKCTPCYDLHEGHYITACYDVHFARGADIISLQTANFQFAIFTLDVESQSLDWKTWISAKE